MKAFDFIYNGQIKIVFAANIEAAQTKFQSLIEKEQKKQYLQCLSDPINTLYPPTGAYKPGKIIRTLQSLFV